jgi:hypothetical protein
MQSWRVTEGIEPLGPFLRSPLERGCSVGDVQNSFGRQTGLKLFMTTLAHVYQCISGAAQVHLALGIDRALHSDSGVSQLYRPLLPCG